MGRREGGGRKKERNTRVWVTGTVHAPSSSSLKSFHISDTRLILRLSNDNRCRHVTLNQ